jgi:hypothetical protein
MHTAPEEYKAKCEVCKEAVAYDESKDWAKCTRLPGHHRVEEKTYYHLGGSHLANLIDRRGWSPMVILRAGTDIVINRGTGEKAISPTLKVIFMMQKVTTSDPEIQLLLEMKGDRDIVWGKEGEEQWMKTYFTPDQQAARKRAELEALDRKITEQNALLAETQQRTQKQAART